jgi:hypothetical protein
MNRIIFPLEPGARGSEVADLQDALIFLLEKDQIRVAADERAKLIEDLKGERALQLYGDCTALLVVRFRSPRRLGDRSDINAATADALNQLLEELHAFDPVLPAPLVVRGLITWQNGFPAGGMTVTAFDCGMNSEPSFGTAISDTMGLYAIPYGAEQTRRAEMGRVHVRIEVLFDAQSNPSRSDISYNLAADQTIDLRLSALPPDLPSQVEEHMSTLNPLLDGVPFADLNAKQIDFLAGGTGIDRQHIEWLVQASNLSQQIDSIPVQVFYACLSQGLPRDSLQLQPISTVRKAILDAMDQHIIPGTYRESIEDILAHIPNRQRSELATVLGRAALPDDKMRAVLAHADALESVSDALLTQLVGEGVFAEQDAQRVGLNVSLHHLAGGEPSLIATLLESEFPALKAGKLRQAKDLTAVAPGAWERAIEKTGAPVPAGMLRGEYARSLAMHVAAEFPHAAFAHLATLAPPALELERNLSLIQPFLRQNKAALTHDFAALDLGDMSDSEREQLRKAYTAMQGLANLHGLHELIAAQNDPADTAKLVTERLAALRTVFELNPEKNLLSLDYLRDSADVQAMNFGALSDEARACVLASLTASQRTYSVVALGATKPNPIPAMEMMQAGFHSASAIALTRVEDFAERTGLPEAEARAYHAAAREQGNAAAVRYFGLYDLVLGKFTAPVRAIPSPAEFFAPLTGFAELIKNQPWCACTHCQSVLSPAAYFVDLMYYIEQNILAGSFKGRETHPLHLYARRPDLWDLELTCKNTEEYVSYLDLINEMLERYLGEMVVLPVGSNLYQHLAVQAGSFQQPFTMPLERLEILLGHFGLSRYAITKAMDSDRTAQVRARLKLSRPEYDLITNERTATSDLAFFKKLFKLDAPSSVASPDTMLAPIEMETLLHATGLAHAIVEAVLASAFVNDDSSANAAITIVLGKRTPEDVQNNSELVKNLSLRRLDRIHRFVRLWRKLPWTVEELDYVLQQLSILDPISRIDAGGAPIGAPTPGPGGLPGPGRLSGVGGKLGIVMPSMAAIPKTEGTLEKIVELLELNAEWSLPIDELLALSGVLLDLQAALPLPIQAVIERSEVFPTQGLHGQTPLFDRLFDQPPFVARDGNWTGPQTRLPFRFVHPAWARQGMPGISSPNNNTLTRLLAGLQVSDKDLVELIESLAAIPAIGYQAAASIFGTPVQDKSISLSKASIGILYRHARLMRLLKCSVTDFVKLVGLTPRIATRLPAEQYIRDLDDVQSVVAFAAWQKASGFSLDEIVSLTDDAIPAALDPKSPVGVLAGAIVARVKTEQSFEFADTAFTQLGLTDLQSREFVLANAGTNDPNKAIEALPDGSSYRFRADFDPATATLAWRSTWPAVDQALLNSLINTYRGMHVLDVTLGSALNLSPEETQALRELAHPLLDTTAIAQGLQAGDAASLTALLTDMLRFRALFKSDVFLVMSKPSGASGFSFVRDNRALFGLPSEPTNQPGAITIQVVRTVAAYVALAKATNTGFTTSSGPADIDALHAVVTGVGAPADRSANLAKLLRTDETRIAALSPHLPPLTSDAFEAIDVLARCLALTERLGVSGETLKLIASDQFEDLARAAEDVFGAFRAKYPDEQTFQEKIEPFEDMLRTRKRDGLVDFIVSTWAEPFADANKLYEYFLIDVLLEGCARTSRVVAAISSLQLYVQRVLMNLEWSKDYDGSVPPGKYPQSHGVYAYFADPEKRAEWVWRKNYRVWEANRKVFLYPENYLEPGLRDDKTPLFKELEDSLLQQEISESNVQDAYAKYLTGFDEVARLKIAGAYYDPGTYSDHHDDGLHLFGVTQDDPPIYYYRVINNTLAMPARVSAWQKLSLQIPVRKVSPILFEQRLYVFWLETTTKPRSKFVGGSSEFKGYQHNVRIKYSTLRLDGAWSPVQSLRFENGAATEEFRIVDDPQTGLEAVKAHEKAIEAAEEKISNLEAALKTAEKKATDAAAVLAIASKKASDIFPLASDFYWLDPTKLKEGTLISGDVLAFITGHALLGWRTATGFVPMRLDQFIEKWQWENPLLPVASPNNFAKMLSYATVVIAIIAGEAAIQADGARVAAAAQVTTAKGELDVLMNAPETRVSVRWDRSLRSHREPLDNYKPEGWEWDRVYPDIYNSSIRLVLVPRNDLIPSTGAIDLSSDEIDLATGILRQVPSTSLTQVEGLRISKQPNDPIQLVNVAQNQSSIGRRFYFASLWLNYPYYIGNYAVGPLAPANSDIQIVNGEPASVIVEWQGYPVWMRRATGTPPYRGTRLGTTLTPTILKHFTYKGAGTLLGSGFQQTLTELPPKISPVTDQSIPEMLNPFHSVNPYRTYFRETFFQIPFLVANHLNSQQKFADAQQWYHFIFDPTAADGLVWRYREFRNLASESLRKLLVNEDALAAYRADPFNPHAIARTRLTAYQKAIVMKYIDNLLDCGDSLYSQGTMEAVNEATMFYVMAQDILGPKPRELSSCGEGKLAQKTYRAIRPSLDKVSDLLIELEVPPPSVIIGEVVGGAGKRMLSPMPSILQMPSAPIALARGGAVPSSTSLALAGGGAASLATAPALSVAGRELNQTNAVVGYELHQTDGNYWINVGGTPLSDLHAPRSGVGNGVGTGLGSGAAPIPDPGNIDFIRPYSSFGGSTFGTRAGGKIESHGRIPPLDITYGHRDYFEIEHTTGFVVPDQKRPLPKVEPIEIVPPKDLVFCIPPNKDLLAYWGRVEDRLFKIRNCMDIAGVRRRLELFAPEIDPRLLVRMKAAGLTLDDVLSATSGNVPPYRFTYLIEKARQYAGTLQSFGAQLLSALEKRDGEELAQLRAVHEQNLLKMRSRMAQLEIDAAEDALDGLRLQRTAAQYRHEHFRSLSDVGLLASESKQQQLQRDASSFKTQASLAQFLAAILSIIPDVGAPTAMKFGGSQLGAAGKSAAEGLNALAAFNEMGASRAGMEASNQRRDQEWQHQVQTAHHDIAQIEKQIAAAEIKRDIAVRALAVHEKTVDQSEEVFQLLGAKFSNFGLYTLHSNRLHGLYRMAYNDALSMFRMAEQAYLVERTDGTAPQGGNFWDAENAGLLAGERLLIELQALERQYVEKNYRQLEIEQAFSLAQFAPNDLATLRLTGECTFSLPEWFFDLTYPGQYRRRLKAARLTIPCVTGPYTNVGATLRLESSEIRLTLPPLLPPPPPETTLPPLTSVPLRHTVAIAASKAQYDAGVFDFNFRDERYMPFEGAGAISDWSLSLPKTLRAFDYGTISDVILHLSYTAEFSQGLKDIRESEVTTVVEALLHQLKQGDPKKEPLMTRSFSLRQEFPDVFHRLVTSQINTEIEFTIDARHVPFFLIGRPLNATHARLRVHSPLPSLAGTTLAIGQKPLPTTDGFRDLHVPAGLSEPPMYQVDGRAMRVFDFGDVLENTTPGIAATLLGTYVITLKVPGPLEPDPPNTGARAIDPSKLHDILLEIGYSLA